jgi:hypothetical protein
MRYHIQRNKLGQAIELRVRVKTKVQLGYDQTYDLYERLGAEFPEYLTGVDHFDDDDYTSAYFYVQVTSAQADQVELELGRWLDRELATIQPTGLTF